MTMDLNFRKNIIEAAGYKVVPRPDSPYSYDDSIIARNAEGIEVDWDEDNDFFVRDNSEKGVRAALKMIDTLREACKTAEPPGWRRSGPLWVSRTDSSLNVSFTPGQEVESLKSIRDLCDFRLKQLGGS
jgi:hypothetical protein